MASKVLYQIIATLIGIICILSAIVKLFPIQFFELNLVENHLSNWYLAPIISRIIIGFEIALGIAIICSSFLHKNFLKIAILTFSVYSIFLAIILLIKGNAENCMCFGTFYQLTPIESILKNLIIILLLIFLHSKHTYIFKPRFILIFIILSIISFAIPFTQYPIIPNSSSIYMKDKDDVMPDIDWNVLQTVTNDSTVLELQKGKHVILFSSLTCKYCKIGAYKLSIIQQKYPSIPIYMFMFGNKKYEEDFFKESKSKTIPHSYLPMNLFLSIAGARLPAIYMIEDGKPIARLRYSHIVPEDILNWLNKNDFH